MVGISVSTSLMAGVHPKIVSERLGHSSIAITLDMRAMLGHSRDVVTGRSQR